MQERLRSKLIEKGQSYINGIRLAFDYPWAIYKVKFAGAVPCYGIYINGRFDALAETKRSARNYLLKLTKEEAHKLQRKERESMKKIGKKVALHCNVE